MRLLDLSEPRPVSDYASKGAHWTAVGQSSEQAHVGVVRLEPSGGLGLHAGSMDQLFMVVEGEGWVSGADGKRIDIGTGDAVFWPAGEQHQSGTDSGMSVVIVQSAGFKFEASATGGSLEG